MSRFQDPFSYWPVVAIIGKSWKRKRKRKGKRKEREKASMVDGQGAQRVLLTKHLHKAHQIPERTARHTTVAHVVK
jgi:hypothetical protein